MSTNSNGNLQVYIRHARRCDYMPIFELVRNYDAHMTYVLNGSGTARFGSEVFKLHPNSLFYWPAGTVYCFTSSKTEKFDYITLNFDLTRTYDHITTTQSPDTVCEFDETRMLSTHTECGIDFFSQIFADSNCTSFKNTILQINEEFNKIGLYNRERASSLLQFVCYRLLDYAPLKEYQIYETIIEYIADNYQTPITNCSIGEKFGYHPNHLNHLFKKKNGITLHKYIIDYRLSKATELLLNSSLSIHQIAINVGFENTNYFSTCFRKKYLTTPTNFRNIYPL